MTLDHGITPSPTPPFLEQSFTDGHGRFWSVPRLVHLAEALPTFELPLAHAFLSYSIGPLTLRELAGHIVSVHNCDLSCPVLLDADGVLMDGRHRLVRAIVDGRQSVLARRFPVTPAPCRVDGAED